MNKRGLKDVYYMRWSKGLVMSLPALVIMLWFAWETIENENTYRKLSAKPPSWNLALFQVALHDTLLQNKRRLKFKTPAQEHWPLLDITLNTKGLQKILHPVSKEDDANGEIQFNGQTLQVKVRQKGAKHWHQMGPKRSLKIRMARGQLLQGQRDFNLSNLHLPFFMGQKVILDLARELGVLTTHQSFAQVRVNGMDLGLFHWHTRPQELTLRRHQRFPGSIYTLDHLKGKSRIEAWRFPAKWEQLSGEDIAPMRLDLRRLLKALQNKADFASFARAEINLEAFAKLEALNMLFGEEGQNFALYFDHYRMQWEPIAYESDAFHHQAQAQLAQVPVFDRLSEVPEYLSLRQSALQSLMKNQARPEQISERLDVLRMRTAPLLAQDPFWQAIKRLPQLSDYHRQKMRPMSVAELDRVTAYEMKTYQRRFSWWEKQDISSVKVIAHPQETVVVGPGVVNIPHSQEYAPWQTVIIQPGTTLKLGPAVSLVFRGPLKIMGQSQNPVKLVRGSEAPWGGLIVQGSASAGSQFHHVHLSGGSSARWRQQTYSGMINLHDTSKLKLEQVTLSHNTHSDDLLHMIYVREFEIQNMHIQNAYSDALDIEFSQGTIRNLKVAQAGDDGLDLMGARITLQDAVFESCMGNGISAGEESEIFAQNLAVDDSGVGVLSKHASTVRIKSGVFRHNQHALSLYQESPNYAGKSQLYAKDVCLVQNQKDTLLDAYSAPYLHLLRNPACQKVLLANPENTLLAQGDAS